MNVVVVSDEPVLAELIKRPLAPLGYRVTALASAAELEARLDELAPRAAILPRRLPDRELAAFIETLRTRPEPVAAIVVGTAARDRSAAHQVDADGFLLVPFADAEVLEV